MSALRDQLEVEKARAASALRVVEDEKERALSSLREQLESEKARTASEVRRVEGEKEQAISAFRDQLEGEKARAVSEVRRVESEAERRLHTLQTRLDWYDANIRREYDLAREKVGEELADLTGRGRMIWKDARWSWAGIHAGVAGC